VSMQSVVPNGLCSALITVDSVFTYHKSNQSQRLVHKYNITLELIRVVSEFDY